MVRDVVRPRFHRMVAGIHPGFRGRIRRRRRLILLTVFTGQVVNGIYDGRRHLASDRLLGLLQLSDRLSHGTRNADDAVAKQQDGDRPEDQKFDTAGQPKHVRLSRPQDAISDGAVRSPRDSISGCDQASLGNRSSHS